MMLGQSLELTDFAVPSMPASHTDDAGHVEFERLFSIENADRQWQPLFAPMANEELDDLANAIADMQQPGLADDPFALSVDGAFGAPDGMEIGFSVSEEGQDRPLADPTLLLSEHEAIVADLTSHHNDAIDELKKQHDEELFEHFKTAEKRICEEVSLMLENKLAPVLIEVAMGKLTEKSTAELLEDVRDMVKKDTIESVVLKGSAELTDKVKHALTGTLSKVDYEQSDNVDLSVRMNDTMLTTRIGIWAKRLKGALVS